MHEYVNISASAYDPAALAAKLTEKAAEGWELVAIVPTGTDTTAFMRRSAGASSSEPSTAAAAAVAAGAVVLEPEPARAATYEPAPSPSPDPVAEPAGWAAAPEPTPAATPAVESAAPMAAATIIAGSTDYTAASTPAQTTPAQTSPAQTSPAQGQAATPAGWYHDPSGRFELRYWDGSQWTEHVARGGQQYTDPPVA